jgi:cytochrome P450
VPNVQDLLGTGLVTSEGALWQKQRKLVSNAFRVEILDEIIGVSLRAVERLVRCLRRSAPPPVTLRGH